MAIQTIGTGQWSSIRSAINGNFQELAAAAGGSGGGSLPTTQDSTAHELTDADDKAALVIDGDGVAHVNAVQARRLSVESLEVAGQFVDAFADDLPTSIARRELSMWTDKALALTEATAYDQETLIMSNALDGTSFTTLRCAGAQMCADGQTIIVFGFTSRGTVDDFGTGDLVYKRITYNKTDRSLNIGPLATFANGDVDPDGGSVLGRYMTPGTVLLTSGPHKGRVLVKYIWRNEDGTLHRLFTRYTDDNGATWSTPVEISSQFPLDQWNILTAGPSPGLQIRNGPYKGRIVLPCWHASPFYPSEIPTDLHPYGYRSVLIYSDDDGVTWSAGAFAPMESARISNECGVAEDWRGDLIWMIRTLSYSNGKALARVTDGGTRIVGDVYQMVDGDGVGVATTQVMAGIIQCAAVDPLKSSAPKLLLSLPNSSTARTLVTLYASYDGGRTWPVKKLVKNGPSAYSIPISLDERTLAVFWENASYTELNLSVFNLRAFLGV